ncbi:TPA: glycosyltransferase family 4 protein [Enterobacter soli]|uniref:glycosyltransferase family 4 protein n=1 Tax=Enterobacter sp. CP102 TaxID=2976431 RepID=UPI0021FC1961|nr:glycosyltransferase family 4 protein [Enterobacter sp. CP102]UWM64361.1 glycosyltransferase family 4 protein [Enterobacter sp. CP102]HDX4050054.1 glycosyltransferase family 4 protein [Enterobacter soli]
MHIVHTEADGGKGGQPLRIINESLGMIQRGHQVTILCPETAPLHAMAKSAGLKVVTMPLKRKNLKNLQLLRRWLSDNRKSIDVINSHNSADTWLVALANLTLSNPVPLVRTRHASGVPRNNWTTRWLFRKACAHIVTTGEALRHQVADIGVPMSQSTSVPSGVDTQRFHPADKHDARVHCGLAQEDFWLGVVSHLRPNKGHSVLLRALAQIDNPHIKLAIVGEGPHKATLEQEIVGLELQQRVVMAGHQSDPERWFPAFDIALSPSHDMEGVPQGVLQSLASRIATIATDAGGTADAVIDGQTGILVAQRDEKALHDGIVKLYDDAALREKLAQQGYDYLSTHFTRECMLDAMEKVFSEAAQRSRSR